MLAKCLILWIGYFAASSNAGTVPSWFNPCPPLDSKCILKALDDSMLHLANGDAVLGSPPIEPLTIKDTEANSGNLKVNFINVKIYNLSQCKWEKFTRDLDKKTISTTSICPVVIKGDYKMLGDIVGAHIFGDGNFSIAGGSVLAKIDMKQKTVVKDGKEHNKLASMDYKFEPISKFDIKFNNMFNGDEEKAGPMAKLVDSNWKQIMLDYGSPIMKECTLTFAQIINKVSDFLSTNK